MAADACQGRWARCESKFVRRVLSSGFVVLLTPRWVVGSKTFIGAPLGPGRGAVADPLIMATDMVGWTMRLYGRGRRWSCAVSCWPVG